MILLTLKREERGWSQSELARRARINPNTVSVIERGRFRPYASQLQKLAKALGVPVKEAPRLLDELSTFATNQTKEKDDAAQ